MASRSRAGPSMAQHRRGHSTGSMAPTRARDEGLALFHEMQSRERTNYLHPSMDDIEAALTTKFGGITGYGFGASPPRMKLCSDLLGLENEKNDYDWLLTPPGTPLFPSLDKDVTADPVARSRVLQKAFRSSSRPGSPSTRKPSPSRPLRPATPTGRPSTPGRSSTPNVRRTLSPSSSFNPSIRSSSPSRKPKTVAHPAMAALSTEQPPNLRTSFPDCPASNSRGSVLSLKLGASQNSDAGDGRGRTKRAVSPNVSRSTSKGSSISSGGHELSGVAQRADRRSVSPVNSQARKTPKVSAATPFSSRKPFDSSTRHMTESRRPTTSGFRPLMSNNHLSSFYTRTSKATQSATESSINSCNVHGSEEEEVASKSIDSLVKGIQSSLQGRERPPLDVEMQDAEQVSRVYDYPSDTPATADLRHDALTSVRSLLESVIDKALDLASASDRQRGSQAASGQKVAEIAEPREAATSGVSAAMQQQSFSLLIDPEYTCSSMEVYQFDQELQTTGSEVSLEPLHRAQSHTKEMMASGTSLVSRDSSLNLSGRSDQSKEVPGVKRPSKRPFQYAPAGVPAARHHITRKKDSRESSLFSIPITSSKGDSISSGRPTSIDDTHSSVDTPRRYLDSCSSSRYLPFEDDTRSEESCIDYYVVQPGSRASKVPSENLGDFVDADDAEGFVDYFIDSHSQKKPQSSSADFTSLGKAVEIFPAVVADDKTLETRDTPFEVCEPLADLTAIAVSDEPLQEQREVQEMEWDPVPSCEQLEDGQAHRVLHMEQTSATSIGTYSAESLLFCSSIVHEIVYKAAALGIEKEDLKKLATPASADELVTFLGLSKSLACSGLSAGSSSTGVQAPTRTTKTTTTVRQSLAYLQNQKVMQNATVSYMQGSLGTVQEDVKAHLVGNAGNTSHPAPPQRKQKSNKCRCTIL